ncbi:MAG TPA: NF038122 family metalloprotease, partial [Blastocatellia bacterium]|nr:NF038122 family metalloprotease [Blastocatellia bacterium]
MKKTRIGLLLCLTSFALSVLIAPPFKQRAETEEAQLPAASTGNVFVTYQNEKGTAVRRLVTEDAADYQSAQRNAERQDTLQEISNRSLSAKASKARGGLFLILRATPELEKSTPAKAALLRAAGKWESIIQDRISVIVNVDFGATYFGQPFQSAKTASVTNVQSLSLFHFQALTQIRQKPLDERPGLILGALPDRDLPTEMGRTEFINCPTPLARTLDILSADADPVAEKTKLPGLPSIGFNANASFDFDPSDGIDADKLDFEALALREFGRILGFTSNAGVAETEPSQKGYLSVWDYFRFRPDVQFEEISRADRALFSGGDQVYFNTGEPLPLSTGKPDGSGGDGNPAGHWKDDALTGRYIGIMDPTLAFGERGGITVNDLDALRLMSYLLPIDAPFIEVLSTDDNSREDAVKLNGALAVKRLTPSYYPAELQSIRLQLPPLADGSSLAGTQLRIVAFVDAARGGKPPARPQFLVDRTITIQNLPENRMLEVMIPNAPQIQAGDLYVGTQSSSPKLTIGADRSAARQLSFLSTDNGASFQPLPSDGDSLLNLMVRAVVAGRIENYATAAVTSLSPASVLAGSGEFILTVSGGNFSFGNPVTGLFNSVVYWNGQARETTYVNGGTLQVGIPARDIAQAGTARVTVLTKTPAGDLESAPIELKIASENPKPVITRLSPDEASVGGSGFELTVHGLNFTAGSVVLWNGAARLTRLQDSTRLIVSVTSADLANAANVEISIATPNPGGGKSNSLKLPVAPCRLEIASLKQASSSLGGTAGVLISTSRQCPWKVETADSWVRLNAPTAGQGKAIATYSILGNTQPTPRTGKLTINGQSINFKQLARATAVSGTRYDSSLSPDSIGALFGSELSGDTQSVTTNPLPTNLAGTAIRIQDPFGASLFAPLFYVSPGQINFLVPKEIGFTTDPL